MLNRNILGKPWKRECPFSPWQGQLSASIMVPRQVVKVPYERGAVHIIMEKQVKGRGQGGNCPPMIFLFFVSLEFNRAG